MDKKTIVAPVDGSTEDNVFFATLKDFPTKQMILICYPEDMTRARELKGKIETLSIPASIHMMRAGENRWEDFFTAFSDATEGLDPNSLLINIATADRISQCALTNAAHVNGVRAVAVIDGKVIMLPIMRLSFDSVLSKKKTAVLKELDGACSDSLDNLAEKTGMSLQLLSYHIHGSNKQPGLKSLELIDLDDSKKKNKVCLSPMGRLLMRGYLRR
jgi:hypothetical protein